MYWFQSRSFTIDLHLKQRIDTPINERQGWIGNTRWDSVHELLSWQVDQKSNYQNHVQWPDPARLHTRCRYLSAYYSFMNGSQTTAASDQWLIDEGNHFMHHAKLTV